MGNHAKPIGKPMPFMVVQGYTAGSAAHHMPHRASHGNARTPWKCCIYTNKREPSASYIKRAGLILADQLQLELGFLENSGKQMVPIT